MFTIKLYTGNGFRQKILEAESFTILRGKASTFGDETEITLHQKNANDDSRVDIRSEKSLAPGYQGPPVFQKAIIENAAGRTTEIITI